MKRLHLWPRHTGRPQPLWFGLLAATVVFMFPLLFAPWLSRSNGASSLSGWRPFGLRGESVVALAATEAGGQTVFYAQTPSGLWRKAEHRGAAEGEWQHIDAGLPRSNLGAPLLTAWSLVPGGPRQLYALAGPKDARQLFASRDDGSTWQLINVAPGDSPAPALAVLPGANRGPDVILIATPSRLWRSLDGGATWQAAGAWPQRAATGERTGGQNDVVRKLLVEPSDPERIVAISHTGDLWLSDNAGLSWHVVGLEEFQVTAATFSGSALWAASTGPSATGLIYSTDRARTWQARTLPTQASGVLAGGGGISTLEAEPGIADSLYAATRGGKTYRTLDGGRTWEQLGTPGATHVAALVLQPSLRSTLYAATGDGIWMRPVVPVVPTVTPTETPVTATPTEPAATEEAATVTVTPSPTATHTATVTPSPSATSTVTATETAPATSTPTATRPTSTATRKPSATPKPLPTATHVPPTQEPPVPPTARPAPQDTPTDAPQPTATYTPDYR